MSGPKEISPIASRKYALKVTINHGTPEKPDKRDYVFTQVKTPGGTKLALLPIFENKVKGSFLAFDTPDQVKDFLKEIKQKYPDEFNRIWKMKPDYLAVDVVH